MSRFVSRFPGLETLLWVGASVLAFIAFLLIAPGFFTAQATKGPQPQAKYADVQPLPTLTSVAVPTALPPFAPAPKAQAILPIPTPAPKSQLFSYNSDASASGWFRSSESQVHWGDSKLNVGLFKGQSYQGILYFDLTSLAPGTKISFADIQLTGLDRERLGPTGTWQLRMLKPDVTANWFNMTSADLAKAAVVSEIGDELTPEELGTGILNQFVFTPEQVSLLEQAVNGRGTIAFRLDGPTGTRDSLFSWNGGGVDNKNLSERPILHIVGQVGQFVSVTNTPTPQNIITAAAQVQTLTANALRFGTATPFPRNYATATPYVLVSPQPTPANQQTVSAQIALATAVAVTTGTYTPTPPNVATAFPTATPIYIPLNTLTPFATATPVPGPLQLLRVPLPNDLKGNILFMSDHFGTKLPLVMKPDGTLLQALSGIDIYNAAHARDMFSPDRSKQLVLSNDSAGTLQVWTMDLQWGTLSQVSNVRAGRGIAYDPAWSPDGSKIAFVSTETGPTEVYVYDLNTRRIRQLTYSPAAVYNQRPSWSPDGQRLVFKSNRETGRFQIWMIDADGSDLHNVSNSPYNDTDPVWVK